MRSESRLTVCRGSSSFDCTAVLLADVVADLAHRLVDLLGVSVLWRGGTSLRS
jgi:hypothetical protein